MFWQIATGLILSCVIANPKGANSQYYETPRKSITNANSQSVSEGINLGSLVGVSHGLSSSKTFTETDGTRNGAESDAYSKNVKIGKFDVSSTIAQSKAYNNGRVSHSLGHNLNVGHFGVGTSLSQDNLKRGFGLQIDKNGGTSLGLGLINIDLSHKPKDIQSEKTEATAGVNATGSKVYTNSHSKSNSERENIGLIGLSSTQSDANAIGIAMNGHTSGHASGIAAGAITNTQSNIYADSHYKSRERFLNNQLFFFTDEIDFNRLKRQQRPNKRRHGFRPNNYEEFGFQQPNNFFNQNSNAEAIANGNNGFFEQQSGANTQQQNYFNQFGLFQQNTGSSIASNLAQDGSSGQLSAANTAQQSSQTAHGSNNQNAAQSQALNFDKNSQQAAASNAATTHIQEGNQEQLQSNSGSMVQTQNQFGSTANTANSNTEVFKDGDRQGSRANANSQSVFQGKGNGNFQSSNTGANSQSLRGPNGFISNSASSSASSISQGNHQNKNAIASASAFSTSGTGPNGSFTNAEGFSGTGDLNGGESTSALSESGAGFNSFGNQAFANGQAGSRSRRRG